METRNELQPTPGPDLESWRLTHLRGFLMGIAMVWIMGFHAHCRIPYLSAVTDLGYLGVDIFMFVSAYGLSFSWERDSRLGSFYRKRAVRILPPYYMVLLVVWCMEAFVWQQDAGPLWQPLCLIGYYFPGLHWRYFLWYIPAILVLYAAFPLLYGQRRGIRKGFWLIAVAVTVVNFLVYLYLRKHHLGTTLHLFFPRILFFLAGLIYAQRETVYLHRIIRHQKLCLGILAVALVAIYLIKTHLSLPYTYGWSLLFLPFLPALPGVLVLMRGMARCTLLRKTACFIGGYTLEIYLIHEALFRWSAPLGKILGIPGDWVLYALFLLTVPLAVGVQKTHRLLFGFLRPASRKQNA